MGTPEPPGATDMLPGERPAAALVGARKTFGAGAAVVEALDSL